MHNKSLKGVVGSLVLLLSAALISCQETEMESVSTGKEITTTISVDVPQVFKSRTVPDVYGTDARHYLGESGEPSLHNVDLINNPLTFTVAVYIDKIVDGETQYVLVDQQCKTGVTDDNAYFNFRLMEGERYRVVAYADFSGIEKADLSMITIDPALNNELSDAFFCSKEFVAQGTLTATLKRPFGKLRLIARDFSTFAKGSVFKIKDVKVNYKKDKAIALATDEFNAITGQFNDLTTTSTDYDDMFTAPSVSYANEHLNDPTEYAAVFTMYLPANPGTLPNDESGKPVLQEWMYPFDMEVTYNNGEKDVTIKRSFDFDIPVKRNYLTTIDVANFWTNLTGISVTIDHLFDGEINPPIPVQKTVNSAKDLKAAFDEIYARGTIGELSTEGKIVLGGPINMDDIGGSLNIDTWDNGKDFEKGYIIHLDLNGQKITGSKGPGGVSGVLTIAGRNLRLYIDDSSPNADGGIEYTGPAEDWCSVITCKHGAHVTINRGNYKSSSESELVYIYETEQDRAEAQVQALKAIGITKDNSANYPTKPTDPEDLKTIKNVIEQLSSTVTINGGWFENEYTGSIDDKDNTLVNTYNVRNNSWGKWHNYAIREGFPEWTDWGEYKNQTFAFVHINGGSFVNFDPSRGDNMVGNVPIDWIGDGKIVTEIVDGKTVYTVIPADNPNYYNN